MSAVETEERALDEIMLAGSESTELAVREPGTLDAPITGAEMMTLYRLARGLSASGMFKDAKGAPQAFAKLIFGRDLGISATAAMTGIHLIEGKPEVGANIQAAKVKASGVHDYRIVEHTTEKCSIEFGAAPAPGRDEQGHWRPWPQSYGISTFDEADAKRAGLLNKDNWKKYPRNMYFARAMSNGVAFMCPDVMNGIRVYAEGEIAEAVVAEDRTPPDVEVVEQSSSAPARPTPEEFAELQEAINGAGIDDEKLQMLLVGVGVDCTEDLDREQYDQLLSAIAQQMGGAQ